MSATHPVPLREQRLSDGRPAYVEHAGTYAGLHGKSRQTGKNWNDAGLVVWVLEDTGAVTTPPVLGEPGPARLVDVAASDRRRAEHQNPLKRQTPAHYDAAHAHPDSATPPPARSPQAGDQAPAAAAQPAAGAAQPDLLTESPQRLSPGSSVDGGGGAPQGAAAAPELQDTQQTRASELKLNREWMAARRTELKLREDMGELIRKSDATRMVFDALRRVRDTMRRTGMDACEAANPEAPHVARKVIDAEIDKKLIRAALEIELALRGEDTVETFGDDGADETAPFETAATPAGASAREPEPVP